MSCASWWFITTADILTTGGIAWLTENPSAVTIDATVGSINFLAGRHVTLGGQRLCLGARDRMHAIDPSPDVDQPAALAAKGERRQVAEFRDLVGLFAGWAAPRNHEPVPPEGVEPVEGVVDGFALSEDDDVDGVDAADEPPSPEADLSAAAPFLYESLR
jgi:hypothetical protein